MRVFLAFYRRLLCVLPSRFRAEFGGEMEAFLRRRLRETPPFRRPAVCAGALVDLAGHAVGEWGRRWTGVGGSRRDDREPGARRLRWAVPEPRGVVRSVRRAPGLSATIVVTLGLGVGVVTAVYSVVDAVILRPLPHPHPERLAMVVSPHLRPASLEAWEREQSVADAFAPYALDAVTVTVRGQGVYVRTMNVGREFLGTLGATPLRGRTLLPADYASDAPAVAVVSEAFWVRHFGEASPRGQVIDLDGLRHEVVGVLPSDFQFYRYRDIEVWTPLDPRRARGVGLLVRLAPGVDGSTAEARLEPVALRHAVPEALARAERFEQPHVQVRSLHTALVGDVAGTLWALFGAAGLVLLVACVNVASLLLVQATERARELSVRAAVGASRGRLLTQLLGESAVLAAAGALLGAGLAVVGTEALVGLAGEVLPRWREIGIDGRVLLFTTAVTGSALFLAALGPAAMASRRGRDAGAAGRWIAGGTGKGARATASAGVRRWQGGLVVVEIALALVLVTGTGLLLRTYLALRPTDPGFRTDNLVVASFRLTDGGYAEPGARLDIARRLLAEVERRSGGAGTAISTDLPLTGSSAYLGVEEVDGVPPPDRGDTRGIHFKAVSPGYLELMEVPLVTGRTLREGDGPVAVVNEATVRWLWREAPAVGRRVALRMAAPGNEDAPPLEVEVVGVVRDGWLLQGPSPRPEIWVPFGAAPSARFHVVVETSPTRPFGEADFRAARSAVDRGVPVVEVSSLRERMSWSYALPRLQATLLAVLGGAGLALATVGCFAVLSHAVRSRRRELGIRAALGAGPGRTLGLVVRRSAGLIVAGLALGALVALASTRTLAAHLHGVEPTDAPTLAGAAGIVAAAALAATVRPALAALRVDTVSALGEG